LSRLFSGSLKPNYRDSIFTFIKKIPLVIERSHLDIKTQVIVENSTITVHQKKILNHNTTKSYGYKTQAIMEIQLSFFLKTGR